MIESLLLMIFAAFLWLVIASVVLVSVAAMFFLISGAFSISRDNQSKSDGRVVGAINKGQRIGVRNTKNWSKTADWVADAVASGRAK